MIFLRPLAEGSLFIHELFDLLHFQEMKSYYIGLNSKTSSSGKGKQEKEEKGGEVVGTEYDGRVEVVERSPSFIRDVCPYFTPSILLVFVHVIYFHTGYLLSPFWAIYLGCPLSSLLSRKDNQNLSPQSEKVFQRDRRFWIPLYTFNLLETLTWIWALVLLSDQVTIEHPIFKHKPTTNLQYFLFTFHFGYQLGVNLIGGHELLHKKEPINKFLGTWPYTKFFYSHFLDEHVHGHHRHIATFEDPATARLNESIYHFIPRSYFGSHIKTWQREVARIERRAKGKPISWVDKVIKNKMTYSTILNAAILTTIYLVLGLQSVKYQLCYCFWGVFFLETVNYVEHYGLERSKDEHGVYEAISKMHSWNQRSSAMHFRLQRHSDHHTHAYRPYQILKRMDEAPTLPFDYVHSLVIVLIPQLWFHCVNPKIEAINLSKEGRQAPQAGKSKVIFNCIDKMSEEDRRI